MAQVQRPGVGRRVKVIINWGKRVTHLRSIRSKERRPTLHTCLYMCTLIVKRKIKAASLSFIRRAKSDKTSQPFLLFIIYALPCASYTRTAYSVLFSITRLLFLQPPLVFTPNISSAITFTPAYVAWLGDTLRIHQTGRWKSFSGQKRSDEKERISCFFKGKPHVLR